MLGREIVRRASGRKFSDLGRKRVLFVPPELALELGPC